MLLSELIPAAAERFPDRAAYLDSRHSIDFRRLETLTARVAAFLQESGLEPGDTVGILLEKTIRSGIAFHGILRAGGVVVPLDIAAPSLHLTRVAADSGLRFVVSEPSQSAKVDDLGRTLALRSVIGLEDGDRGLSWESLESFPRSFGTPKLTPTDPAYLVYTSGSTGIPKGIEHSHRSGFEFARRAVDTYRVNESDVISGFPPLHFDQSTFEMLAAPLAAASVVLIHDRDRMFAVRLTELVEKNRITIWYSVPTALIQMLDFGIIEDRDLSSLRWIKFGGEVFPMQKLRALMERIPTARFSNVYGPAEVNQCTFHHMDEAPPAEVEAIPLGPMWSDSMGLVRSEDGELFGTGDGELCVSTPTMMTGYWRRPEETAASTLELDVDGAPARFYATGDAATIDRDGTIWFRGRIDHQVKVRGVRVELEAVDAALGSSGLVAEAAAFIGHDVEGAATLCAAVVPLKTAADGQKGILKHVKRVLPPHAVPEKIYIVKSLPRNANGKVDRTLLSSEDFSP